jgi:HD-GYP domain-containing protein (c-di-GMP phosphodiesterase class II)
MTHQQAIRELFTHTRTQFDPRIVEVFARLPRAIVAGQPIPLEDRGQLAQREAVVAG